MAKKKTQKISNHGGANISIIEVPVTNKNYGSKHRGRVVRYEGFTKTSDLKEVEDFGRMPKIINKDGSFNGGKNLLDVLVARFGTEGFQLTISNTDDEAKIKKSGKKYHLTLPVGDIKRLKKDIWEDTADVKNELALKVLSRNFPKFFTSTSYLYKAGTLERIIPEDCNISLNLGDKERIRKLYAKAIVQGLSTQNVSSQELAQEKAIFQLSTLETYADDLEKKIKKSVEKPTKDEGVWQTYIKEHITNLREEYLNKVEKLNVGVVERGSFPDFLLLTQDNFLDVLEIKTPNTPLVVYDSKHDNYFLSSDVSKAVAQAEKYIEQVSRKSLEIETYLSRTYRMPFGVVRPGALILIGSEDGLLKQKNPDQAKADFRRLRGSFKEVKIITYTELLSGLRNRIGVLKKFIKQPTKKKEDI